ncbi:hypothetical protein SUDANB96_03856 [Streptomyces sp. enrichment culture]
MQQLPAADLTRALRVAQLSRCNSDLRCRQQDPVHLGRPLDAGRPGLRAGGSDPVGETVGGCLFPSQGQAAAVVEVCGQTLGVLLRVEDVVDVVSGVALEGALRPRDLLRVGAQESGDRRAGCGQGDEGPALLGVADRAVRVDDSAEVVPSRELAERRGDGPRFAAVRQAEFVEAGPGFEGAEAPDGRVVGLGEVGGAGAFGDAALVRRQRLERAQEFRVSGVDLDGQPTSLPGLLRQVPVRLQEAEHVRVLRDREVHELVSDRSRSATGKPYFLCGQALGRDGRPCRGPSRLRCVASLGREFVCRSGDRG